MGKVDDWGIVKKEGDVDWKIMVLHRKQFKKPVLAVGHGDTYETVAIITDEAKLLDYCSHVFSESDVR